MALARRSACLLELLLVVPLAQARPVNVQCDLTVAPSKASAGRNVMTTSEPIMGAVPINDSTLASVEMPTYNASSTIVVKLSTTFSRGLGLVHASAGTLSGEGFSSSFYNFNTGADEAVPCQSPAVIAYATAPGASAINWTAPSVVTALPCVKLSIAAAHSYGVIKRYTVGLLREGTMPDECDHEELFFLSGAESKSPPSLAFVLAGALPAAVAAIM